MVTSLLDIHPFEKEIIEHPERYVSLLKSPTGVNSISAHSEIIGKSRLLPLFLSRFFEEKSFLCKDSIELFVQFIPNWLELCPIDFVLAESIDLLIQNHDVLDNSKRKILLILLDKAKNNNNKWWYQAVAIEGALRFALLEKKLQPRFLDYLFNEIDYNSQKELLSSLSTIVGVAYSHLREPNLISILQTIEQHASSCASVKYEIGLVYLINGLESSHLDDACSYLKAAQEKMTESIALSEVNPSARLYSYTLDLLLKFYNGLPDQPLPRIDKEFNLALFELKNWAKESKIKWLGARHSTVLNWQILADKLVELSEYLSEESWWAAAEVVEKCLLPTYLSSRSILHYENSTALEKLIQPRIDQALIEHKGLCNHVRQWATRHPENELYHDVALLLDNIQKVECSKSNSSASRLNKIVHDCICDAIDSVESQINKSEAELIECICSTLSENKDFSESENGRKLTHTILILLIRFLTYTLDHTRTNAPDISYLFEESPGESTLQLHFHKWCYTYLKGGIEISDIGGGRADLLVQVGAERIVIEVKRELTDASFENLLKIYNRQATEYQNTGLRIGFLLVLDLTQASKGGGMHLSHLMKAFHTIRDGELEPRTVIIAKVSGRRELPSDFSRKDKKRQLASEVTKELEKPKHANSDKSV